MSLKILTTRQEIWNYVNSLREQTPAVRIGFVPTMGALHEGHASLIRSSAACCEVTILSLFVNPLQFGPHEDFDRYPKAFLSDCQLAKASGACAVFCPSVSEMYPEGFSTKISLGPLTELYCGKFRPGHFDGVCTVVLLLLNLVRPDFLFMGEKDFQQVFLIKKMLQDLSIGISLVVVPTLREKDGLAMSSRNSYLSQEGRHFATVIPRALASAAGAFLQGERRSGLLLKYAKDVLEDFDAREKGVIQVQYLSLFSTVTLQPIDPMIETVGQMAIAAILCVGGKPTRLIDTIVMSDDPEVQSRLQDLCKCDAI